VACPRLQDSGLDWMQIESVGEPVEDALAVVMSWPEGSRAEVHGCLGDWLRAMPGVVDPQKALKKLGLKRAAKRLSQPLVRVEERGQSLGGIHAGWLRQAAGGAVALRWSRASQDGWPAMDRAATAWFAGEEVPEEWDVELLRVLLDEAVLGRNEDAARDALACVERLVPRGEPTTVEVEMDGPAWLQTGRWTGTRAPRQARQALRMDGMNVGGTLLVVRCVPPLRTGARPQPREPRAVRQRRLFSLWHQGVQVDEEGLYSLTPEALALEVASDCSGRVLDATCGVGGLAIALARRGCSVVAVDTSAARIRMAQHNAALYGVELQTRVADATEIAGDFDHVVVDPPWGGRDYERGMTLDDVPLARAMLGRAPQVHLKLPVSFDVSTLGEARVRAVVDELGRIKFLWATCTS
jgi:hypothetical protein